MDGTRFHRRGAEYAKDAEYAKKTQKSIATEAQRHGEPSEQQKHHRRGAEVAEKTKEKIATETQRRRGKKKKKRKYTVVYLDRGFPKMGVWGLALFLLSCLP